MWTWQQAIALPGPGYTPPRKREKREKAPNVNTATLDMRVRQIVQEELRLQTVKATKETLL